jgi:phytoene synthase
LNASASQAITRKSASNLALAFVLLPREQRSAMSALYAFCREVDDVVDDTGLEPPERRARLAAWRADLQRACDGGTPHFAVSRELQPVIQSRGLKFQLFDEIIRGCEMDLDVSRYGDWPELDLYCDRVASAVGLLSIEIFGHRQPACRDYAVALGRAFQLTNILRDVGEDARRGRLYLPLSELQRQGVPPEEVLSCRYSERFRGLAAGVAERARGFYRQARAALPVEDRPAMIAAELMGAVYWRLLGHLESRGFNVFEPDRIRVGKLEKLLLVVRTWWRLRVGPFAPGYG